MIKKRQRVRKTVLLISMILFPITLNYFSPYLVILGASRGIVAGSMITFATLFLSSLFLGRLFCGWICPAGAIQEIAFMVNGKRPNIGRLDWIKYLIVWSPWITIIIFLFIKAGGVKKIDPFFMMETGISVAEPADYMIYLTVVGAFLMMSLIAGKRAGCHAFCWIAPFMVIGRKIRNAADYPALRLKSDSKKCVSCGACTKACPMSLDVQNMVEVNKMRNSECILCGECIDACPNSVIRFSYSKG